MEEPGRLQSMGWSQGCTPKRLLGRPDEALGGGNQGPSAPGWARHSFEKTLMLGKIEGRREGDDSG